MVVKSKVGRKRYIIFKIDTNSNISKRDIIYALNILTNHNSKQFLQLPWIIYLKENFGLIRCHHLDRDKTIVLLQSIKWAGIEKKPLKIQTLGTAGTIRSARKKYLDKLNLYPFKNSKTK